MTHKNKRNFSSLRELREWSGLFQSQFWPLFGCPPSSGRDYEAGLRPPPPLVRLLHFWASDKLTEEDLIRANHALAPRKAGGQPRTAAPRPFDLTRLRELREQHQFGSAVFWRRFGVGRQSGEQYELGQPVPKPLALLIWLWHSGRLIDEDLTRAGKTLAGLGKSRRPGTTRYCARFGANAEPVRKARPALDDLRELREWHGMTLGRFWSLFGVTGPCGASYESGPLMSPPVALLLRLWYSGKVADEDLIQAGKARLRRKPTPDIPPFESPRPAAGTDPERKTRKKPGLDALRELREWSGMPQHRFWYRFGIGQGGGSRYEFGSELPKPLVMLLSLWHSGRIADADMDTARETLNRRWRSPRPDVVLRFAKAAAGKQSSARSRRTPQLPPPRALASERIAAPRNA